jgi:hypothetical protein
MQPILAAVLLVGFTLLVPFYRRLYSARMLFFQMQKSSVVFSPTR